MKKRQKVQEKYADSNRDRVPPMEKKDSGHTGEI